MFLMLTRLLWSLAINLREQHAAQIFWLCPRFIPFDSLYIPDKWKCYDTFRKMINYWWQRKPGKLQLDMENFSETFFILSCTSFFLHPVLWNEVSSWILADKLQITYCVKISVLLDWVHYNNALKGTMGDGFWLVYEYKYQVVFY